MIIFEVKFSSVSCEPGSSDLGNRIIAVKIMFDVESQLVGGAVLFPFFLFFVPWFFPFSEFRFMRPQHF